MIALVPMKQPLDVSNRLESRVIGSVPLDVYVHVSGCPYHNTQRTRDAIITSLLRHNDVATSLWRNDDVIIAPCAR